VPKIGVATQTPDLEALVDADLDTPRDGTAREDRRQAGERPPARPPARLSQSELVCLAVAQALLGFHSEHRWIRFAICQLLARREELAAAVVISGPAAERPGGLAAPIGLSWVS
jgi:hypothetical protein